MNNVFINNIISGDSPMAEQKKGQKAGKIYRLSSEAKLVNEKYTEVANLLSNLAYGKSLKECLGHKETIKLRQSHLRNGRVVITLPTVDNASGELLHYIKNIGNHLTKNKIGFKIIFS